MLDGGARSLVYGADDLEDEEEGQVETDDVDPSPAGESLSATVSNDLKEKQLSFKI